MVLEAAARLGIGVALAWAALPLLMKLARRSRSAPPADYYRALLAALCMATALIVMPLVRGWSGAASLGRSSAAAEPSSVSFVAELVSPLVSTAANALPSVPLVHFFAAIGGLWLLLLAAGITASITRQLRLYRDYERAVGAPDRVLAHAERIAVELRIRTPPIHVVDGPAAAFTYGAVSPVVVLSPSSCELRDDELDFVLRHELCHVARHDTRAMCLIDFAQRCFAGHPNLPALASEIRVAREARADEVAAGAYPLEYARFLLTIAAHIHSERTSSASLVSMADTALERRVEILINPGRSRLRRSMPWLALTAFTLSSLVLLTPASWGQPEREAGGHPIVKGNLSVEQVEKGLFTNAQPMLDCYNKLPAPRPNLPMHVSVEIDESGRVTRGQVSVPDHPELEPCLHAALMQKTFPRPSSGTVTVAAQTLLTPPYVERSAVLEARESARGSLPADVIQATVRSYYPQLRECFERLDGTLPSASLSLNFIIDRTGEAIDGETVDTSNAAASTEAFGQLARCVDDVRRTMRFPAPEDGIVTVNYPMLFSDPPCSEDSPTP